MRGVLFTIFLKQISELIAPVRLADVLDSTENLHTSHIASPVSRRISSDIPRRSFYTLAA